MAEHSDLPDVEVKNVIATFVLTTGGDPSYQRASFIAVVPAVALIQPLAPFGFDSAYEGSTS
jgi:hypothetical protein